MDCDRAIGRDGTLPWHLPNDLRRFRAITMGKPILMGRRTHASIGRPLPGRRNLVLSRDPAYTASGCETFTTLDAALATIAPDSEAMIVGGAELYRQTLPRAHRLYLTDVLAYTQGDVFFPALDPGAWREVWVEHHARDARHAYAYRFRVLERVIPASAPASS